MKKIFKLALYSLLTLSHAFVLSNDLEVIKIDSVGYDWHSVSFENSYSVAPIVTCSYNLPSSSASPAVVRINNLTASGFSVKIQKPIDDSSVTSSSVQCIVATEGQHTLSDGYKFEAGKVLSTDTSGSNANGWSGTGESLSLIGNYGNSPAVLGQVMSYNDSRFSTFWTYNCSNKETPPTSTDICVGKHIGETGAELADPRAAETLGYIVIEGDTDGDGKADPTGSIWTTVNDMFKVIYYNLALGSDTIDGVDDAGDSYTLDRSDYDLGVATQNAMDGNDGGWAVYYGSDPFGGSEIDLAIEEDTLDGSNRTHTEEQVAYWVLTDDPGYDWMEVRKLSNIGSSWTTVDFDNSYTNPVAVCTYNLPDKADHEAVVRISEIGSDSMKIKIQRPINTNDVTASDTYCIIMEDGNHTFDGRNVEAHTVLSDGTNRRGNWSNTLMENVGYEQDYSMPVVLGQVMSYNDPKFSAFWTSNGTQDNPPDKDNLFVGKHIGKEPPRFRKDETIGYIVGASHEGEVNHTFYAISQGDNSVEGVGNQPPYNYSFSSLSHKTYGYGVASQNAENGGQGGWATLYGNNPISTDINLAIDGETVAGDTSRTHTKEQVSYWVFDPYPNITITKTSCVLRDGINIDVNAKRITGSTIRYTMEVNNTGFRTADNVIVEDNLSNVFSYPTIKNLQIQDGSCDCLGAASASNNGSNGTANGQEPIKLDFGNIPQGNTNNPTTKCGYFEVNIK